MPSTPIPSTVSNRTVVLATPRAGRVDLLCSLPLAIIRHSVVLDAAYKDLMTKFFDRLRLAHAERLTDLNTCRTSVNNAVRKWTKEVQTRAMLLGSNPGTSSYNVAVDTVRLLSNTLRRNVNNAEDVFLASRAEHDAAMKEHAAEIKQMLEEGIRDAIQAYLQGCVASCLEVVGDAGNLDPWLAQLTTRAMDFQSRVLAMTAEFSDLPMELRTAAVLQQMEMFIATARMLPATCPLSYPVPMPRPTLPPASNPGKGKLTKPVPKAASSAAGSSSSASKPKNPVPAQRSTGNSVPRLGGKALVPTPAGQANPTPSVAGTSSGDSLISGPTLPLRQAPGSYSYTSIISHGLAPTPSGKLPVAMESIQFGVPTPLAVTRLTGGCAPVQTVAPSATTTTITTPGPTPSGDPQHPIDCVPVGTKCRHNKPMPSKKADPDIIPIEYEPTPIAVINLADDDEEDTNSNKLTIDTGAQDEKSPTAVPEKKACVGSSPAMAKGVAEAGAQIGLAVVRQSQADALQAYADKTVGSLSSSSSSSDDEDTPAAAPVKAPKKKLTKKKKEPKSREKVPDSSNGDGDGDAQDAGVEGLRGQLNRSATLASIHAKACDADFTFIKELHQEHDLPTDGMTQDDISHFLPLVDDYRRKHMKDPNLRKLYIFTVDQAIDAMNQNLSQPKTAETKLARSQWKAARKRLEEIRDSVPMPQSQECKGVLPPVYTEHVARVFVTSSSKALAPTAKMTSDEHKRVILGISKLHKKEAISRRQEKNVDGGSRLPLVFPEPLQPRVGEQSHPSSLAAGPHVLHLLSH